MGTKTEVRVRTIQKQAETLNKRGAVKQVQPPNRRRGTENIKFC